MLVESLDVRENPMPMMSTAMTEIRRRDSSCSSVVRSFISRPIVLQLMHTGISSVDLPEQRVCSVIDSVLIYFRWTLARRKMAI